MLKLYEPIDRLKAVAPDVWIVDGPAVTFYGMPFPTRMTVIRLATGKLWLHSPVAPAASLVEEVTSLGSVTHLVSPNWIHYCHIPAWKTLFPGAKCWASPGVRERAASKGVPLRFDADLGPEAPSEWATELRQRIMTGSAIHREVVFFHLATKTLILTDLIENFEPERLPWWVRPLARMGGVVDPHGGMPRDMRTTFRGHHAELRRHIDELLSWGPERVILAHGRWFESDGSHELARAFLWLKT